MSDELKNIIDDNCGIRYKNNYYIKYLDDPSKFPRETMNDRIYLLSRDIFLNIDDINYYLIFCNLLQDLTGSISLNERKDDFKYQDLTREQWLELLCKFRKITNNHISYNDITIEVLNLDFVDIEFFENTVLRYEYCESNTWFNSLDETCNMIETFISTLIQ